MRGFSVAQFFTLPSLLVALILWGSLYFVIGTMTNDLAPWNIAALVLIMAGCAGAAYVDIHKATYRLWYPMPWFLITSSIYYGFGPLLYYFSTPETIDYVDRYFPVNDWSLWRVTMLNIVGMAGVITLYLIVFRKKTASTLVPSLAHASTNRLHTIAALLIIIGLPVKLLFVLPRALGLWEVTIPGTVEALSMLSLIALIPLFELRTRPNGSHASLLFFLLLTIEVGTALITLSKLTILKIAIMLTLAWVLRGATMKRLLVMGMSILVIYVTILTPLVTYGRFNFNVKGVSTGKEVIALAADFRSGAARAHLDEILPNVQGWWSRLNYANAQAFAMVDYERGVGGDTFNLILWTFVPRFIYPEKPITTTGSLFNELVTNNPESKSAPGMFAEGYWNAGWVGVAFVATIMGLCFALWEKYNAKHLLASNYKFILTMWMGLFPALQQDSWFVPGVIGWSVIAIAFHWIIFFIFSLGANQYKNAWHRAGG